MPGKKSSGPSGWVIPAKLQIYLWLGMLKHKKNFINGIPKGYELTHEIRNVERPRALPPSTIHYIEKHVNLIQNLIRCSMSDRVMLVSGVSVTSTRLSGEIFDRK